jgi:hypothetical protein
MTSVHHKAHLALQVGGDGAVAGSSGLARWQQKQCSACCGRLSVTSSEDKLAQVDTPAATGRRDNEHPHNHHHHHQQQQQQPPATTTTTTTTTTVADATTNTTTPTATPGCNALGPAAAPATVPRWSVLVGPGHASGQRLGALSQRYCRCCCCCRRRRWHCCCCYCCCQQQQRQQQ